MVTLRAVMCHLVSSSIVVYILHSVIMLYQHYIDALVTPLSLLMVLAPILLFVFTSAGGTATTTHVTRSHIDMHAYIIWWYRYHYS